MSTLDTASAAGAPARPGLRSSIRTLAQPAAAAGALVALIAFFLPWAQYQNAMYSGFDMAGAIAPALAEVRAGGLKGFHIALHAMPVLAVVSLAFLGLSWLHRREAAVARESAWAGAAAIAGLAIAVLFVASATLGGIPGTQFAPGLVRTDAAVATTAARTLNAGEFIGLGAGIYLTIAGFAVAAAGSLLGMGPPGIATAAPPRAAWRTQDYVLLAVLAIVFGALYWWWLQPYLWIAALAAQVGQEFLFGMWFVAGLLGGYIIRRPGAAFLAETLAALAEVLLGAPAGPILVVTGIMQALGPEIVFAATGYRRWGWTVMIAAGIAAGLVALPWNWFRLGYFALAPEFLLVLLLVRMLSGALAGALAKGLGDLLAATGGLNYFAIGRERMREV